MTDLSMKKIIIKGTVTPVSDDKDETLFAKIFKWCLDNANTTPEQQSYFADKVNKIKTINHSIGKDSGIYTLKGNKFKVFYDKESKKGDKFSPSYKVKKI